MSLLKLFSLFLCCNGIKAILVKVEQGTLRGKEVELATGDGKYFSFKGIPYAKPPVGKLRFRAPEPPTPWEGVRNATEHGPICIQRALNSSEDCLFINVYTPNMNPYTPLPVMVYIHGGSFLSGSGNDDDYGPDYLVRKGVVVVTMNYRLEVLGLLCLDIKEVPGNAALKDQVAALRWVKKNIKNFGGDSRNVTIFGQSTGGASISLHLISPMSKGLFKRAISMSGVFSIDHFIPFEPQKRAFLFGKQLGLYTKDTMELLQFLQSVPAEKLIGAHPSFLISDDLFKLFKIMSYFTPVIEKNFCDEQFMTVKPYSALEKCMVNEANLMIGHTDQESLGQTEALESDILKYYPSHGELLVPWKIETISNLDTIFDIGDLIHRHYFGNKTISLETIKEFIKFASDSTIYDIHRYVRRYSKVKNSKSYFYIFAFVSERNIYGNNASKYYGITGASHTDDLPYLFYMKNQNFTMDKNSRSFEKVEQLCTLYTNFAKFGNPTPDLSFGITWPEYNDTTRNILLINDTLNIRTTQNSQSLNFWEYILEYAGIKF